ncbi:RDD family protein [Pengzhenrongella phosphoraccumulans]|uniref:RDD family protein n=1 Tax=Pengzhenrongella phosphoraccumulans TaxID=3114394 RepID=UPI00388F321F
MSTPGALSATMGKRLLAFVIDQVAYLIVGGGFIAASVLDQVHGGEAVPAALVPSTPLAYAGCTLLVGLTLFQWWFQGARGFTLGKRAVGLRTLSAATGQPAGMGAILLRQLVVAAGALVGFGLGQFVVYASAFFDASGWRQGWHDRAAGTIVYDIQVGIDPATADAGVGAPRSTWRDLDELPETSARSREPGRTPVPAASVITGMPGAAYPRTAPQRTVPMAVPMLAVPPWAAARAVLAPLADDVEMTRMTATPAAFTPLLGSHAERVGLRQLQATLQLWDGRRVLLAGTALVGRSPAPRAGELPPSLLLEAIDQSVSKTHLAIGIDADGLWVQDRSSTNGTVVTLPDGSQILCAPEQRVRIPAGSSVAFGDCWFEVVDEA